MLSDHQVRSIAQDGWRIVIVYNDNQASVLEWHFDHERPLPRKSYLEMCKEILWHRVTWSDVMRSCTEDSADLFNKEELACLVLESTRNGSKRLAYADCSRQFNDASSSDIKFLFNGGHSILHAHSNILVERSQVFLDRFEHGWDKSKEIASEFNCHIFRAFLFYVYSRKYRVNRLDVFGLIELYDLAEQYFEPWLKREVTKHLYAQLSVIISVKDLAEAYRCAQGHNFIENKIAKRLGLIISNDEFLEMVQLAFENNDKNMLQLAAR